MKAMKWHLCCGGYHRWPDTLKRYAACCCKDMKSAPDAYVPDYVCAGGKHGWSQSDEAERCCNGYVPVWQTMGDAATQENPFEVRMRVLVPSATVTDMDDLASAQGEALHLYLPM